jgi:hypothetical protein
MSGEWIAMDCNTPDKVKMLELVELTGLQVEVCFFRMFRFWCWVSMNTADGRLRASPKILAAACGGDESFWRAVADVGWITFDGGMLEVAGWDKRFSQAAKARAMHARRQGLYRERQRAGGDDDGDNRPAAPRPPAPRPAPAPTPEKPPAKPAAAKLAPVEWTADGGWSGITAADRAEWAAAYPGAVLDQELARATAWLHANPTKAGRRNWRRFLLNWLSRSHDRGGTNREPGRRPGPQRQIVSLD